MLIKQDKTAEQAFEDSFEIIKYEKYHKYSRELLYVEFFKYCLAELNIPSAEFSLDPKMFEFGSYIDGSVTFGKQALKSKYAIDALSTIAHELRHYKQDLTKPRYKVVDSHYETTYPLPRFMAGSMRIYYEDFINNFAFYYTSISEKDARDYSVTICDKYLAELSKRCGRNRFLNKFYQKNFKHLEKAKEKDAKTYKESLADVKGGKDFVKMVTQGLVNEVIEKVKARPEGKHTSVEHALSCIINMYCDDKVMKSVFDFCISEKDAQALISCMNCPNSNITKEQFMQALDLFEESGILKEKSLEEQLSNWNPLELKKLCLEHDKKATAKLVERKVMAKEETNNNVYRVGKFTPKTAKKIDSERSM